MLIVIVFDLLYLNVNFSTEINYSNSYRRTAPLIYGVAQKYLDHVTFFFTIQIYVVNKIKGLFQENKMSAYPT